MRTFDRTGEDLFGHISNHGWKWKNYGGFWSEREENETWYEKNNRSLLLMSIIWVSTDKIKMFKTKYFTWRYSLRLNFIQMIEDYETFEDKISTRLHIVLNRIQAMMKDNSIHDYFQQIISKEWHSYLHRFRDDY